MALHGFRIILGYQVFLVLRLLSIARLLIFLLFSNALFFFCREEQEPRREGPLAKQKNLVKAEERMGKPKREKVANDFGP